MSLLLIAHRGNINGPNPEYENQPNYIESAIAKKYHVEIDLWYKDDHFYLGHDSNEIMIGTDFLLENCDVLWCHAKNLAALQYLNEIGTNCFGHSKDDHVLTSEGWIFTLPGAKLGPKCVVAMPEWAEYTDEELQSAHGVCTDYPERYRTL